MTENTQENPSRLKHLYEGKADFQRLFFRDWLLLGVVFFLVWAVIAAPLVYGNAAWFNQGRSLYMQLPSPVAVALMVLLPAFWFIHTLFLAVPLWKTLRREHPARKVAVMMLPAAAILGLLGFSLYWLSMWFQPLYIIPVLLVPHLLLVLALFLRKAPR